MLQYHKKRRRDTILGILHLLPVWITYQSPCWSGRGTLLRTPPLPRDREHLYTGDKWERISGWEEVVIEFHYQDGRDRRKEDAKLSCCPLQLLHWAVRITTIHTHTNIKEACLINAKMKWRDPSMLPVLKSSVPRRPEWNYYYRFFIPPLKPELLFASYLQHLIPILLQIG